jgi:hypothetical protein
MDCGAGGIAHSELLADKISMPQRAPSAKGTDTQPYQRR